MLIPMPRATRTSTGGEYPTNTLLCSNWGWMFPLREASDSRMLAPLCSLDESLPRWTFQEVGSSQHRGNSVTGCPDNCRADNGQVNGHVTCSVSCSWWWAFDHAFEASNVVSSDQLPHANLGHAIVNSPLGPIASRPRKKRLSTLKMARF
jgi:hypothetical protein